MLCARRPRVVERQARLVEHATQLALLVARVAEGPRGQVSALDTQIGRMHPLEEGIHQGAEVRAAVLQSLGRRQFLKCVIDGVQRTNAGEAFDADQVLTDRRPEEVAAAVGETADERNALAVLRRRPPLEDVVDVTGIALQIALEAVEERLDDILRVALDVGEEHVIAVSDGGEEVARCDSRGAEEQAQGLLSGRTEHALVSNVQLNCLP